MPKTNQPVTLQKVDKETFEEFLGLIEKLAEYEELTPPDEKAKERLRHDGLDEHPKYQAVIGKIGNQPVGYIVYFFTYSTFLALPTLFLEDIFVLKEYRQQGVGTQLFDFIKVVAKREGCGRIELAVLRWNRSAQQFYERQGACCLEWFLYRLGGEDF
jgi:GNAT superfamily N-acetyltransferase